MGLSNILITASIPFISAILYVACIGYQKRSRVNQLRKNGMVGKHSFWLKSTNCARL